MTPTHPQLRPIDDDLRRSVKDDLSPEIDQISSRELREKVVEAWCVSLTRTSYRRLSDVPGWGGPNDFFLKRGNQSHHLRGVARFAMKMADDFVEHYPEVIVNRDVVIAGSLCHDLGKPWEFDPVNQERWTNDPAAVGNPTFRHSVYGVHIALTVGLPEEVAHICLGHSLEGQHITLAAECQIVRQADHVWWLCACTLGLLEPDSIGYAGKTMAVRKTKLDLPPPGERAA